MPHLPALTNKTFGREEEIEAGIRTVLDSPAVALLTLSGPGGCGKTRIAIEIARCLAGTFEGGVWFASLAEVMRHEHVYEAALRCSLILAGRGHSSSSHRGRAIAGSLLVLDEYPDQGPTSPVGLRRLIEADPKRRLILTSRRPANISGECCRQITPFSTAVAIPVPGQPESLGTTLFLERAKTANPAMEVRDPEMPAVRELCVALGGVPLAIELAAGTAVNLRPAEILTKMKHRFWTGDRAYPQQPLFAAVNHAYCSLPTESQDTLGRLAVLRGNICVESANSVGGAQLTETFLGALASRCLLAPLGKSKNGTVRYRMAEPVREYAWSKLSGLDRALTRNAHARHFLGVAESFGTLPQSEYSEFIDEHGNFATALQWAVETENVREGFCMAASLQRYWEEVGATEEARFWLRKLLAIPDGTVPSEISQQAESALSTLI